MSRQISNSVRPVSVVRSVRRLPQVLKHSTNGGTLPRLFLTKCLPEMHAPPVMAFKVAAHLIDGSTASDSCVGAIQTATSTVDISVSLDISVAKRFADLLGKELRIWSKCISAANCIYLIQCFLSMGWYLLAANGASADVHWAITKDLLIFSMLLYYTFEWHNQISGHEADRIDKPYRPIPSGLLTLRGASYRLVAVSIIFMLHAWSCGVLVESVCLQIVGALHYWFGWHSHWFTKNLWNGIGISMMLVTASHIVMNALPMGSSAYASQLSAIIGIMVFLTIQVQDLGDAKGDTAHGRYSLLHAIGQNKTRWVTAVPLFSISIVWAMLMLSFAPPLVSLAPYTFIAIQLAYSFAVCAHILMCRGASHDAKSFMMYVLIVVSWCFTPLLIFKYLCCV